MNALLAFVDRHPLITGAIGTGGGVWPWVLAHLGVIQGVAAAIGAVFGALCGVGTFLLMLPKLWQLWLHVRGRRVSFRDYVDDELP